MIKVMVFFEREDEIKQAVQVEQAVHDMLEEHGWCTGQSWQNKPPKTWTYPVKETK